MAELNVELVSVDRRIWSGEATMVKARTVDGDIGILPGHWNHLSALVDGGVVDIRQGDESILAAVDGGFLLVHDNEVRILATVAELGSDVDVESVRSGLQRSRAAVGEDGEAPIRRAEARLTAAGHHDHG